MRSCRDCHSSLGFLLVVGLRHDVLAADKAAPAAKPAAKEQKPQPAFNDPAKAGPDFLLQGEYAGANYGVQVIARGHGKFHSVGFNGGLPGGLGPQCRHEADGEVKDGSVTFLDAKGKTVAVLAADTLTVKDQSGATTGTLKKVSRQSPTKGAKPPAGAIVLFDGTSVDQWKNGKMTPDHLLMEGATSKQKFGDATFHLEFRLSFMPFSQGQGPRQQWLLRAGTLRGADSRLVRAEGSRQRMGRHLPRGQAADDHELPAPGVADLRR